MAASDKMTSLAIAFSKRWENASYERGESQTFLNEFLNLFGITFIPGEHRLEYKLRKGADERRLIDCLIKGKIVIEMKSEGKDLDEAFEQLEGYVQALPPEDIPKVLMVCDFETIIQSEKFRNILIYGTPRFIFELKR
jgi:hypothetical protein